ncbi:MAG: gamma-glutamylcyclotransferase [Bdellovibrio sp.]|nr:gamma-glutamylcyclotransferase [Bdellovibrio sp.]
MTTMRFFVIGSWTEGMLHFQKLRPFIVSYEKATIRGQVYRLPAGFPVIVQEGDDEIVGQLVELKHDDALVALMDAFHGVHASDPAKGLHKRETIQIQKSSGDSEEAQIYIYNPKKLTAKAQKIAGTVWQDLMKLEPPMSEQLTERQKLYVMKLGAAKGRDIIPIDDLTLYRELMKLELIVDKGRRLALSSLGKEVYNHLI